jgi:hypothetical protein
MMKHVRVVTAPKQAVAEKSFDFLRYVLALKGLIASIVIGITLFPTEAEPD